MDAHLYINSVLSLCLVLGIILLMGWAMRKFGVQSATGIKGRRLQVLEMASVDLKRKLVLIRRDNKEHLIMTGPSGDILIETNIAKKTFKETLDEEKKDKNADGAET